MVYQLILCLLRGLALGEFLYNFDKVVLEILGSAGWGCTLPGRVFVEYGLYSVLCATRHKGNDEQLVVNLDLWGTNWLAKEREAEEQGKALPAHKMKAYY